jgi:hypothetical protein
LVVDGVEMLDVREAAQAADRTPETVRRWIWSGRLNAQRHGNRLLVTRRDLESLVHGADAADPLSLAEWVDLVAEQRTSGALGPAAADSPSAADLILEDRRSRDAG